MTKINDGGPAYPTLNPDWDGNWTKDKQIPGKTLRDSFAESALIGLLSSEPYCAACHKSIAVESYSIADAMLIARGGE